MKILVISVVGKGILVPENANSECFDLYPFIDLYDHAGGDYPDEPIMACLVDVEELAILARDYGIMAGRAYHNE